MTLFARFTELVMGVWAVLVILGVVIRGVRLWRARRIVFAVGFLWLCGSDSSQAYESYCNNASAIKCEDFEARSTSQPNIVLSGGDAKSPVCTRSIVGSPTSGITIIDAATTPEGVHSGSRAIQLAYPAGNDGTDFMDCSLGGSFVTMYFRWYVKYSSNWQWSGVATKHEEFTLSNGALGDTPMLGWTGDINTCGVSGPTGPAKATIFMYTSSIYALEYCGFPRNVSDTPTLGKNQWYCLEAKVTANTSAGANNGAIQFWIDDVEVLNHSGFDTFTNGTSRINGTLLSGYWNNSQSHDLMYRWEDDWVLSTSRVGCLAGGGGGEPPTTIALFFAEAAPVTIGVLWHFRQAIFSGVVAVWLMGGAFLSMTTQKTKQIGYVAATSTVQGFNKVLERVRRS